MTTLSTPAIDGPASVFHARTLEDIYVEIRNIYERYPQPWVVGYSGGKDSTTVLQLVWKALEGLPPERRQKPVFVIATDTRVETPVIIETINGTLNRIDEAARAQGMPFETQRLSPTLNDSFWVNLLGRGYPAPTTKFRWCTERMKINPADKFIQGKVGEYGEVIMLLGMRRNESATRGQLMNAYQVHQHILMRHASLPGAYVYAPIADWTSDDVWTYLLQVPSPWGGDNRDLAALYRSASQGECPLVIDDSTPSCGNSRFGCWVCTVATRDSSMEAVIDSGEDWLEPLLEFREFLMSTTNPETKRKFRDIRGRDGRLVLSKDGTGAVARTYKLDVSKEMLERLLKTQQKVKRKNPNFEDMLISEDELLEIRRIWRTERQDWDDSVPKIYESVVGQPFDWPQDDNNTFDGSQKELLANICGEFDVPLDLVAKLLEVERRSQGLARRAGIQKGIGSVLKQDWRSEEQFAHQANLEKQGKLFEAWDDHSDGHNLTAANEMSEESEESAENPLSIDNVSA